jgi:hypothetical protein
MGFGKAVLLTIPIALVVYLVLRPASVNEDLLKSLKADTAACQRQVSRLTAMGIIRETRRGAESSSVIIDDQRWAASDYNDKVATALYTYCLYSPADGRYTVYVKGLRDGSIRGSVHNGNWWSN